METDVSLGGGFGSKRPGKPRFAIHYGVRGVSQFADHGLNGQCCLYMLLVEGPMQTCGVSPVEQSQSAKKTRDQLFAV